MKNVLAIALVATALSSCSSKPDTEEASETASTAAGTPTFTKVWETDSVMTTAESTLYDSGNNIIYVSNIDGHHSEKDGKGFISVLKPDGSISKLDWLTGLNAPKGMAILDGSLYVTDIDELVQVNIASSSVVNRYPVQDAAFLNDAATDGKNIYFSDTETGRVHVLENGTVNLVTEGMDGINGLAFNQAGQLFILDGKGLHKYIMADKNTESLNDVVTGGDGLVVVDDSTFIASRWQGEIYLIRNGKEHLLLDTKSEGSNTADIDYVPSQKLVLVPTFMKNRVAAYKLDY